MGCLFVCFLCDGFQGILLQATELACRWAFSLYVRPFCSIIQANWLCMKWPVGLTEEAVDM